MNEWMDGWLDGWKPKLMQRQTRGEEGQLERRPDSGSETISCGNMIRHVWEKKELILMKVHTEVSHKLFIC